MSAINLTPLYDRVVIRRLEQESKTAGGIVIPDTAAEKPHKGEVIAVGTGKLLDDGKTRPLAVKPGDKVLFGKYSGTDIEFNNEKLLIMKEEDLLGVIA